MRSFSYMRADSEAAALQQAEPSDVQFLAGGTTLVDLMKLDVLRPAQVVDITPLRRGPAGEIRADGDGLRLGALVSMAEAAAHPAVQSGYPVLADSLRLAASAQLRNMASLGGNLLQRTRCPYYRDTSWHACNKREPGSGCAALEAPNRMHAVLGTSPACIATYPGDLAVALVALDAMIDLASEGGRRSLRVADLHRPPGETPERETNLAPGEMILAIEIPAMPWARRSLFLKIRDRASYEFALASAAVALDLQDGVIRQARVALGGLATVPWRAHEAEQALEGKRPSDDVFEAAAEVALVDAQPLRGNGYKVLLGKRTIIRALRQAASMEI
ncbi:MAG: xanthine dehydrogenase family protein subunit M [Alphaproteobacteria bacterium]|nr:xanthine dehydrogenase family protein subunit M [Alphaproteobacteria bacterium]